jgi:hypothetical protein
MKRLLFLLIFFSSQIKSQDLLITNTNQNDLWIGLSNPLCYMIENSNCDSLTLISDNGIVKIDDNIRIDSKCLKACFFVTPIRPKIATIKIVRVVHGDTILIGQKMFNVRELPNLIGYVGGKDHIISKETLAAQLGIVVEFDDKFLPLYLDLAFKAISYSVIIKHKDNLEIMGDFKSNIFPQELKDRFFGLEKNDKVLLFDILAINPNQDLFRVEPIELTIK